MRPRRLRGIGTEGAGPQCVRWQPAEGDVRALAPGGPPAADRGRAHPWRGRGVQAEHLRPAGRPGGQGMAVLVVSSETEEVLGLADRIVVMRDGRLVADLDGHTATEEELVALAFGAQPRSPAMSSRQRRHRSTSTHPLRPRGRPLLTHQHPAADYAIIWVVLAALRAARADHPELPDASEPAQHPRPAGAGAHRRVGRHHHHDRRRFRHLQGAIYVAAPLVALAVEIRDRHPVCWPSSPAVRSDSSPGRLNGGIVTLGSINSFIATLATSFIIFGLGYIVSDGSHPAAHGPGRLGGRSHAPTSPASRRRRSSRSSSWRRPGSCSRGRASAGTCTRWAATWRRRA